MNEELRPDEAEFARRTRALLEESAAALPASTRSRLTQARYATLEQHAAGRGSVVRPYWRRWLPAGAASAAVLALLLLLGMPPHPDMQPAYVPGAGGGDDLELLADRDALALTQDVGAAESDVDYEFYGWAVGAAQDDAAGGAGT